MKQLFTIFFLFASLLAISQVNETEPNNSILDASVLTINDIETYTGDATGETDFWKVQEAATDFDYSLFGSCTAELIQYTDNTYANIESYTVLMSSGNISLNPSKSYAVKFTNGTYQLSINSPLPVEFVSFTGLHQNGNNTLTWTTASEENNAGFEIYGMNGEEWIYIDFIAGQGTTTEKQDYIYKHRTTENYYYQLKQIDFDGNYEYSNIIYIEVPTIITQNLTDFTNATFYNLQGQEIKQPSGWTIIKNEKGIKTVFITN